MYSSVNKLTACSLNVKHAVNLQTKYKAVTVMYGLNILMRKIGNSSYEAQLRNNRVRGMEASQAFTVMDDLLKASGFS